MDISLLRCVGLESFVSIDVEATGLDIEKDRIIEISACKYINGELKDTFTNLINPNLTISSFISRLTGITNKQLLNKPAFADISSDFIKFIQNQPLVGHNINFDLNFINKELNGKYDIFNHRYISDTYYLSKIFLFFHESFKLSSLCENFNIDVGTIHRAEQDAQNTAKLFLNILNIIIKVDINILSTLNRCIKNIQILNKELLTEVVQSLIQGYDSQCENYYNDKIAPSFSFINKANNENLSKKVEDYFKEDGILSKNIKNYEVRSNQIEFTKDCAKIINESGLFIAEADTGIGKTFSYLLASMININKKNVVISTSTHSLQEQIFSKDIPALSKILEVDVTATIVKGMNNYVCRHRLNKIINQIEEYLNHEEILEFLSIILWSQMTNTGDISECNSFRHKTHYKIWDLIKYENEECPLYFDNNHKGCFYQEMIESSKTSSILIINHALLGSSFIYKYEDFIDNSICIVDEAHKFIENFRDQLKESISFNSIKMISDGISSFFIKKSDNMGIYDKKYLNKEIKEIKYDLVNLNKNYNIFLNDYSSQLLNDNNSEISRRVDIKFIYSKNKYNNLIIEPEKIIHDFNQIINKLTKFQNDSLQNINKTEKNSIKIIINRCKDFQRTFSQLFDVKSDFINWISMNVYRSNISSIYLHSTPFFIQKYVNELINKFDANIFCSATLTINDEFEYFTNDLGIDIYSNNKEILLKRYSSNFYLDDQIKSFVLNTNHDINSIEYLQQIFNIILKIKQNIKKRMLVLCTSYSQIQNLKDIARKYGNELGNKILFQDSISSRKILLNKYLDSPDSVLVGTNTFWEGLDLPNDKLEILLIIKIPFSNPYNPIVKSKIDYISSLGMNSFLDYQLPESVLKMKQGIGRLIRSHTDMGICILTDPRLLKKRYGAFILDNLDLNPISFTYESILIDETKKFFR